MTKLFKTIAVLQVLSFAVMPMAALAATTPMPTIAVTLTTVQTWITRLADWIFTLILALAAVILLVGAFNLLTAGGDATKIAAGKNWIIWGIVGVIVAILAKGLLSLACTFFFGSSFAC